MSAAAIADIQSRIANIQSRIKSISGTGAASGTAFADTLNTVLGSTTTSANSSTNTSASSTVSGQDAVDIAKQWLGTPYVYGGNDPEKGIDCSALVQQAYGKLGIELPRVAADQAKAGTPVSSMAEAKPGDLLAFGNPVDHIGIYAGDNKMVVAPKTGDVVKIQEVYKTPVAIRRIVEDSSSSMSSASSSSSASAFAVSSGVSGAGTATGSTAINSGLRSQYDGLFASAGAKYNLNPNLLAAVAKQESGFNANAKSSAGATGLMQIMPGTAKGLGVDATDPTQAVEGAAKMLSGLIKKFGSVELALAGYNAGPNAVTKHGGIPPYKETQNYVKNVVALSKGIAA